LLTSNFESPLPLIGCGIDAESVDRFRRYDLRDNPLPMVFSSDEISHIRSLSDRALGLCASFCCKEALFKALGKPYTFNQCHLFYEPHTDLHHPTLSLTTDQLPEIGDCTIRFLHPRPGELVAVAHLFGLEEKS